MKILISGSSGLVGSALIPYLTKNGHEVIKLVRQISHFGANEVPWDLKRGLINPIQLENLDAVIHLSGDNIASGRWTEEKKKRIRDSRLISTRVLCRALKGLKHPPKVLICASAVGYYGDRGDDLLTEESSKGTGFLSDLCAEWQAAAQQAVDKGIRVVFLRFGAVLSPTGGMLKKMITPFKWGLGGVIGSGQQYISWISIDDALAVVNEVLKKDTYRGSINTVSPNPVTNQEFTQTLGELLHRPTLMWMPALAARLVFGEMADDILLASTRAVPEVLQKAGFKFSNPDLKPTLKHLLR